ncbi:MAG TPA: septum formation initiator family protein [Stellaceae bacterium]|nr:septum formation initiator family protein [Stellaceae bacterium]
MSILRELRRRARLVVTPVLGVSLVAYFAYHLVQGDRGFIAWLRLNQEVREAKVTLAAVTAERETIEHRVSLLRPEHLDRDMLDERARSQLNLIGPNETVIFTAPVNR